MDSNDNSQSVFVQDLESTVKTEPIKIEPEESENIVNSYSKQGELVTDENSNDYSTNGQKRKSSENSQVEDRMSENSSELTSNTNKRRRYTDTLLEDSAPDSNIEVSQHSSNIEVSQNSSNIEESQKFTLVVSNASSDWTSKQVLDYISDASGVRIAKVNDCREGNSDSDFQIKLNFVSKEQLNRVWEKLKLKEVEGKLTIEVENEMVVLPIDTKERTPERDTESIATVHLGERDSHTTETIIRHNQEYETDTSDFYIKEDYLQLLGISPPITNWINVTNFRCDKSELKEVLELAGKVLVCTVVTTMHKYANAMYSHPLEAVQVNSRRMELSDHDPFQAVSMLNGQTFYGKKLKVTMNNSSHVKTLLPKGLVSVGPGLGKFGKSVPDLSEQYDRFIRGQNSAIDASLFQQDLLDKIGVTVDPDTNFMRAVETPYSQTSQNDLCIRNSEDSSENVSQISHMDENQFGPIGQKPPGFHNLPISDFTAENVNMNGPNASMNRTSVPNQRYCPPISVNDEANRLVITSAIISGPHPISGAGLTMGSGSISGSNHMASTIAGAGVLTGPASGLMTGSSQISSSAPISGPVPMSNSGSMPGTVQISGSGAMSGPGPTSGPSVISGPGSLPMSGPGTMSGLGSASGHGSMTRPGLMSSGVPMSGAGSLSGPIPMSGHGNMTGPGPISGLISRPGSMSGPGPIVGPVPMSGPGSISGRGNMLGPNHISGPGHMSGPGPMSAPGRMSAPASIIGACPRPMAGSGLRSGQMTGPRGPGPNQMVHISIGPRAPMNMNRFPVPVSPMLGPRSLVPSGPTANQIRPNGPRHHMPSGCNIQMYRSDPVTLQISNLPPNTNFLNLGHKLSELGHVVYLEFTTPGCAVVRFASPADAERCFQNYRQVLG